MIDGNRRADFSRGRSALDDIQSEDLRTYHPHMLGQREEDVQTQESGTLTSKGLGGRKSRPALGWASNLGASFDHN